MKNQRFIFIILPPSILLIIPLIAMQYTNEVNWGVMDFFVAGILLFGSSLLIEFTFRRVKSCKKKLAVSIIIILVLLVTWAELAVGIFNTPLGGN